MKIKGAGGGAQTPPVEQPKTEKTGKASGSEFAGKLDRLAAARAPAVPTPRVWGPSPSDELRAVTAELRSGKIDALAAAHRIIDDVITRRIGSGLPLAMQKELRTLLGELTTRDPALASKIQRLAKRR
ncbi:MAG TPA: hypothetical protein VKN99_03585 [Polyangia bacterium]|nr:hypothetical protein [Polyangia bacterium]